MPSGGRPTIPPVPQLPFAPTSDISVSPEVVTLLFGTEFQQGDSGAPTLLVHSAVAITRSHALSIAHSLLTLLEGDQPSSFRAN